MFKISKTIVLILCLALTCEATTLRNRRWTTKPPIGTKINWGNPITKGLRGVWLCNEGAGNVIYDATGGQKSTLNSPSWTTTLYGKAPVFSDVGTSQIDIPHNSRIDNLVPISVFQLFLPTVTPPVNGLRTLMKANDGANGWEIFLTQTTLQIEAELFTNNAFPQFNTNSNAVVVNQWVSMLFTWGGPIGTANGTIYVNGVKQGLSTNVGGSGTSDDSANDLFISDAAGSGAQFNGPIAVTYIWNRVLTDVEARELYENPFIFMKPPSPNNAFWFPSPIAAASTVCPSVLGSHIICGGGF